MLSNESIPMPDPQTAATAVDGQAVIVMADSGQVTVLNEVGSRIWELCDGSRPVEAISAAITAEFDVSADQAAADVHAFLERLVELGAIRLK